MSDVTFGVKMPEELKQQIDSLIKESGLRTGKDFMQSLVNGYVLEKTKESIPEVAEDLKELQTLTQRIDNIYLNLGYRIENINKAHEKESQEQLLKKDSIITDLQDKIETINFRNSKLEELNDNIVNQNNDLLKRVNELTESNNNIKALIEEYKSKNDTLTGILEEYKGYKAEIEEYKKLLSDSQARNIDKENIIKNNDYNINNLNTSLKIKDDAILELKTKYDVEVEKIKKDNIREIEQVKKESQLNIKLSIAEVKEELNNKLAQDQLKHNTDIQEYQNKYKLLLEELEKVRSIPKSRVKNDNSK